MAILIAYAFLNLEIGSWSFKGFGITLATMALLFSALGVVGINRVPSGFNFLIGWLVVGTALLVVGCLAALVMGSVKKQP